VKRVGGESDTTTGSGERVLADRNNNLRKKIGGLARGVATSQHSSHTHKKGDKKTPGRKKNRLELSLPWHVLGNKRWYYSRRS